MEANLLFPRVVDEYRQYLVRGQAPYISFCEYCKRYKLRYASVTQWLKRHGLSVGSLYYEALLEKCDGSEEQLESLQKEMARRQVKKPGDIPPECIPPEKLLKGITVTFPDGIVVSVRHATPASLTQFIEYYNKQTDIHHVRTE